MASLDADIVAALSHVSLSGGDSFPPPPPSLPPSLVRAFGSQDSFWVDPRDPDGSALAFSESSETEMCLMPAAVVVADDDSCGLCGELGCPYSLSRDGKGAVSALTTCAAAVDLSAVSVARIASDGSEVRPARRRQTGASPSAMGAAAPHPAAVDGVSLGGASAPPPPHLPCPVAGCPRAPFFRKRAHVLRHVDAAHTCHAPGCSLGGHPVADLDAHVAAAHPGAAGVGRFRCPVPGCDAPPYTTEYSLHRHVTSRHAAAPSTSSTAQGLQGGGRAAAAGSAVEGYACGGCGHARPKARRADVVKHCALVCFRGASGGTPDPRPVLIVAADGGGGWAVLREGW